VTSPDVATDLVTLTDWMGASLADRERGVMRCLERIASVDHDVRAWAQVSPQPSSGTGPLAGIPFGAKDIMETRGPQMEYGSPVYRGRVGHVDAAIVSELEARGAVLLGKTHTTAFAYITPAPTRNPRHLDRTPGGSSSGSAAAVAAGQIPLALGTQTKGSVLRPASYCGITGFKPSFGAFSMDGILPVAPSLDTLGFFTHTPADMIALWEALGRGGTSGRTFVIGFPEPFPDVDPVMEDAIAEVAASLRRAGVSIRAIDLEDMLSRLADAAHLVMFYEGGRLHRARYEEHGDRLGDLAALVRDGLQIPERAYHEARRFIEECRRRLARLYETTPVIMVPAATGAAPVGLSSTGDPRMNAPWTALGVPAISIPMPGQPLPLGLQLTSAHGQDSRLLAVADAVARVISQ